MAVYAPDDDPPPNTVDPGMWARLMGYVGGLSPIGSAQAAEAPAPGPTVDSARRRAIADAQAQLNAGNASHNISPPTTGPTPPIISAGQIPTTLSSPASGGGASGGFTGYDPLSSIQARQPLDPNDPRTRNMPWPTAPSPMGPPVPPGGVQPVPATATAAAPAIVDPRLRGEVPPAQSPWITTFDRPNQNPGLGGGMMGGALAANQSGRGGGGPSQMGMLDLSHLFGGGQPAAAAPAAQPRTKIDVGKIPASARAEVPPVSPGPMDPSIIARQRMKRPKASSSSQGGGY